jgi:hypothetical protein
MRFISEDRRGLKRGDVGHDLGFIVVGGARSTLSIEINQKKTALRSSPGKRKSHDMPQASEMKWPRAVCLTTVSSGYLRRRRIAPAAEAATARYLRRETRIFWLRNTNGVHLT